MQKNYEADIEKAVADKIAEVEKIAAAKEAEILKV